MFRKCKVILLLLFLIISLSFTPSVNAASDIFNEPSHLSYDTLKSRMTDYINTPDYFKPYAPPVIYSNEYVDFDDYIDAAEDFFNVDIDDDVVEEIADVGNNIPLFKDLNVRFIDLILDTKELCRSDVYLNKEEARMNFVYDPEKTGLKGEEEAHHDGPGDFLGVVDELHLYIQYKFAGNSLRGIVKDNVYLMGIEGNINFIDPNKILVVDGVQYTALELFERVGSSCTGLNGKFEFTNTAPLASGVTPKSVSVASVIEVMNDNYVLMNSGTTTVSRANTGLKANGYADMPIIDRSVKFKSGKEGAPKRLLEKGLPASNRIISFFKQDLNPVALLTVDEKGNSLDISPEPVSKATKALNLKYNAEGKVVTEVGTNNRIEYYSGLVEAGFMFVFAIVTFIVAWVYR